MYVRILERREISFEQIGHRDRAGVGSDLDASPLLDHVGKVALEYLARLGKRHGRVSAELFLSSLSISPLLRHPIGRHAFRHRIEDEDKTACAAPFAIRSEEHTSELQSLMRISYAVFCLNKKKKEKTNK